MIIEGQVYDPQLGMGVPYASVELTDQGGNYMGFGVSADGNGVFTMDSPMIQPGSFLRFSQAAYQTKSVPYDQYVSNSTFTMTPANQTLPLVSVTAPAKKQNSALILGGIALVLFLVMRKK